MGSPYSKEPYGIAVFSKGSKDTFSLDLVARSYEEREITDRLFTFI